MIHNLYLIIKNSNKTIIRRQSNLKMGKEFEDISLRKIYKGSKALKMMQNRISH